MNELTATFSATAPDVPPEIALRAHNKHKILHSVTVRVPGNTANLGPGFDTIALALGIYVWLRFDIVAQASADIPLVENFGAIAKALPGDESNLVYKVCKKLWQGNPEILSRLRIKIYSDIPMGRGLGSSASAIAGAAWAAYKLAGKEPDLPELLKQSIAFEGHADNLSAAFYGGVVICARAHNADEILTQRLSWPDEWKAVIVVPQYPLSTEKARSVLPPQVKLTDAVENLQRTAMLVSSICLGKERLMIEALHDKLHEPYRCALVPELSLLQKFVTPLPVLGCVLSGAGSSILVLVQEKHRFKVEEQIRVWASEQKRIEAVLSLDVDGEGLVEVHG